MKKWLISLAALSLVCSVSCSSGKSGDNVETPADNPQAQQDEQADSGDNNGENQANDAKKDDKQDDAMANSDTFKTNGGYDIKLSALPHQKADAETPVYFISEITPESLVKVYQQLHWEPKGKVGVKMSTGESAKSNHLRPEMIKDLVHAVNGTIVECNTAYGGSRATTEKHWKVIEERGFKTVADVDILDAEGSMSLPVDGKNLKEDFVGSHFANYDSYLVLSHFKGHAMGGFGGAIKNLSIGFGSSEGKLWIHSAGRSKTQWLDDKQDEFLESMAEAAKAVTDAKPMVYVSVMNRLSVDCDCDGNPAEPDMHDIGVLASTDPLAIDQAAIDIVYAMPDKDSLVKRIERQNGLHTLDHAEAMKLGHRDYKLVVVK